MRIRTYPYAGGFGDASPGRVNAAGPVRVYVRNAPNQEAALEALAQVTQADVAVPIVRFAALQATSVCPSQTRGARREDIYRCELEAIFNAVKFGAPNVDALVHGFRYVSDPKWADLFTSPARILEWCLRGANGGDCDDHTALVCALLGSLGWTMGLRAWGPKGSGRYEHVFAVTYYPKHPPYTEIIGLDTTEARSTVGWQPEEGDVLTRWLQ